jgi:prevent-host-death family protein
MWSVVEAKSQLSEILRRARAGEPQTIGSQSPCVVVSAEDFEAKFADHDGAWLLDQAERLNCEIKLPARHEDRNRPVFG